MRTIKLLILTTIVLISSCLPTHAQKSDKHTNWGNYYLQEALAAKDKGKQIELYKKAISLIMDGMEKLPERKSIFYRELGLIYELGIGTEIDYNKALDYYKKMNPDDNFSNLYYLQSEGAPNKTKSW